MKGRKVSAEEARYFSAIKSRWLCWCCTQEGIENREEDIQIHHTEGKTAPGAHKKTIPLCDGHHSRYKKTGLHYNLSEWEERWGAQEDLVKKIQASVEGKY